MVRCGSKESNDRRISTCQALMGPMPMVICSTSLSVTNRRVKITVRRRSLIVAVSHHSPMELGIKPAEHARHIGNKSK